IECRGRGRKRDRVAIWEDEDTRAEADPVGHACDQRQGHEWIEPLHAGIHRDLRARVLVGIVASPLVREHYVVRGPERVEAELLGGGRDREQHLLAVIQPDVRERYSDAHSRTLSRRAPAEGAPWDELEKRSRRASGSVLRIL